jgi:HlyD family secretion protein
MTKNSGPTIPRAPTSIPVRQVLIDHQSHNGSAPQSSQNSRRARRRWPLVLKWCIPLFVIVALLVWWRARPLAVETVRPQYRFVVESIAATGQVRGNVESNIGAQTGGRIARLLVREGDRVRRGQILAYLDEKVLLAQVRQAADAVRTAQTQLVQVSRPPLPSEIERARADTAQAVDVARARLASARQRLAELRSGPTREERRQAEGQVHQANAGLAQARLDYARQQRLFTGGKAQRGELEQAITAYHVAQEANESALAQLRQARLDMDRQQELFQTSASADLERAQTAFQVAQKALDRANAELVLARQNVERQRKLFDGGATPRAELDRSQSTFEVASAAVEQARTQLEQTRVEQERQQRWLDAGNVPRAEWQRAQTAVRVAERGAQQARAQLEGAREELARQRQLFNTNNRAELDRAASAYRSAQGQAITATARLRQLQIGPRTEEIAQAAADVRAAESTLAGAQRSGSAQLETLLAQPRPEDIAVARARLTEARQTLELARRRLGEAVVVAPFDGIVTQVLTEVGGITGANAGIVRLVRIGVPELRVDVDENNLGRIKPGQKAIVTSDAFPDARFEARVREIGAEVDAERGTVEVRLDPLSPPRWLRSGLTVSVNIIVDPGTRRLTVPLTAVSTVGTRSKVLVARRDSLGWKARQVQVKAGPLGPDGVPILSQLTKDDLVITGPPGLKDGQWVQPR